MAYVRKSQLNDSRIAQGNFDKAKSGKKISQQDTDHLIKHLDIDNLSEDDEKRFVALKNHNSTMKSNKNHEATSVNDYNGAEQWITINGHHLLVKPGHENYKQMFKETDKKGEHHASVKRRTSRPDGTAKAGDKREFDFSLDTKNHPPDPHRAEQDKKHNLVTIYQGKDDNGADKFRRINLKELKQLRDQNGRSKKFT